MKKIKVFLLLIMFAFLGITSVSLNAEEKGLNIKILEDDNIKLEIVNADTMEELDSEFVIQKTTRISIKVENIEEGYRIAYWLYKYKKISDNSVQYKVIPLSNLNEFTLPISVGNAKDYEIEPIVVKENNKCAIICSSTSKNVVKVEELKEGKTIKVEKTDGKGFGLDGLYIIENNKEVKYNNDGIEEDIIVYVKYSKNAASIFTVFVDMWPSFLKGLGRTILFSVVAVCLALLLGGVVCLLRLSDIKVIKFVSTAYVEIIRGVPLLLQLLIIYNLFPNFRHGSFFTSEIIACLVALIINSSAYVSEILRSGIQAVDKGQMEAARAIGLTKWQALLKIVIPQGIKNCLPSIGNELIMVIKETSLTSSVDVAIGELMSVQSQYTSATYLVLEPLYIVGIMYFVVTFSLSKAIRYIERRLETHD